ncbi:MAG: hypothetical protein AB7P03_05085 [Kofleriaceae bacterium]
MAQNRRGGGFRPPEIRGTLGTLLRTTLQQAGVVRDVLERGAREGRSRLDEARAGRRRQEALAELGEIVLELIRRGEIDLEELPEARAIVRDLEDLDADGEYDRGDRGERERARDDRGDRNELSAAIRGEAKRGGARSRGDADGTVSSRSWSPPRQSSAGQKVWRPPDEPAEEAAAEPPPRSARSAMPPHPHRKGGITFDDDEDLADYMHPDDVPPKEPPDGDR